MSIRMPRAALVTALLVCSSLVAAQSRLPATELTICEIQGDRDVSPHVGVAAITRNNVVTAVGPQGFFIQIPDGLALAGCRAGVSRGIYAFTNDAPTVQVGQVVDVHGTVTEFFQLTEVDVSTVAVRAGSPGVPAPIEFGPALPSPTYVGTVPQLEPFEGMLVRLADGVTVGPADAFGDFHVIARGPRPFRGPGVRTPGLPRLPVWDGNPEIVEVNPERLGGATVAAAAGLPVSVEGPLAFDFGDYQIWPTAVTVTGATSPRAVRARQPGEFTVATQNLRLFDTIDDPGTSDETPSPAGYAARLTKISALVRELLRAPDVLVVQEVETEQVLADLALRIAADDPSVVYTPYLIEGRDIAGLDVGVLVRSTVIVDALGQIGKDTAWQFDGAPQGALNARPPLVVQGRFIGSSADPSMPFPLTVIGVHQQSLDGVEGASDAARRVRQQRYLQAVELAMAVQSLQQATSGLRAVVAGAFNAFEFTDGYVDVLGIVTGLRDPRGALLAPPADLVEPNLTNWTPSLAATERYSAVVGGSAHSLDHVVTTTGLNGWVRGVEHARGNADAPASLAADATTVLRASDRDGTVLFVMGDFDGDGFADDRDACVRSDPRPTVVIDGRDTGTLNVLFSNGCKVSDSVGQIVHVRQLRPRTPTTETPRTQRTHGVFWGEPKNRSVPSP